jgi:hypothetical protein
MSSYSSDAPTTHPSTLLSSTRFAAALATAALVAAAASWSGCVDVDQDPPPDVVIMEFDTEAEPARIPEPNIILINQETGLIDFSLSGLALPEDCSDATAIGIPRAQCEFYQYLEGLDGFPTLSTARAPSTEPLDLETVTIPDNLLVLDSTTPNLLLSDSLSVGVNEETSYLTIDPLEGWDVGKLHLVAVRGYDDGVQSVDGKRVITNQTYFLLKEEESLTCGADTPEGIPEDCKYLELLEGQYDRETAAANLIDLEALRQGFLDAWPALALFADMSKEEVAMLWAFPTHTASVAELQPQLGMLPEVISQQIIRVAVKGPVASDSVREFHPIAHPNGNVLLLDLTELMQGNQNEGFPLITASYDENHEAIEIEATDPLVDQHLYCIIFKDTLTNPDAVPFVASPVTVFLRSEGELVSSEGISNVSSLDDSSAAELEQGRIMLAELLDDPDFIAATGIDSRDEIVYLYAFTFPDPTTSD